ncbi:MAG: adenylosuccinate lyase [Candidatus Omnitrophica bacterium CG1_02_49_10]|nr:MAG: adenylosuccinate lyase [Candidatus Omnitrophica bacterium CG1_02_49_10]
MIERYTLPGMAKVWSEERRFRTMLDVEILACEALCKLKVVPKEALAKIKKATFDVDRIKKIEESTKHDVIAFILDISEGLGDAAKYIHLGLTSSDVLDTSLSILLAEAADILLQDLAALARALKKQARKHKFTVMVGRSHGIHAEPTTFGLKMALFFDEINRDIERLKAARKAVSVAKISGAVGTYANIDPFVEEHIAKNLKLKPARIATQVIQRDIHAEYVSTLAIIGATLEKIATEIRGLQRTEVLEAEEPFSKGQKGSSAMPHKRNPVICERVTGLARILRGNAVAAIENVALWHERDISHSSVERVILPDSTILLDYMLNKMTYVIDGLMVYPENMKTNMAKTGGLIFSQRLMLELINKGLLRKKAYDIVQADSMKVWQDGMDFKNVLLSDEALRKYMSASDIEACFDVDYHMKHVGRIFKRVGV